MQIDVQTLRDAVRRGVITEAEAVSVWANVQAQDVPSFARAVTHSLSSRRPVPPIRLPSLRRTALATLLVAAGSTLAILGAHALLGPAGEAVTAAALSGAPLGVARHRRLRRDGRLRHVFISAAALLAPVAVHGLVRALGHGAALRGGPLAVWLTGPGLPVAATAIVAAALALRSYRVPFMVSVVAAAIWFAAQDAAPLLFGGDPAWYQRALLSSLTGVALLTAGLAVDRRGPVDHALWLYLPGLAAFCGGLTTLQAENHASLWLVGVLHAGLVAGSLLLERRSFAVAGALGLAAAVWHVADDLLDARALAFALTGIAVAMCGLGLLYHVTHQRLERRLAAMVPAALRRLLPPGAGSGAQR